MSMFADDDKLMGRVRNEGDCRALQRDLDSILGWSIKWEMEFNIKKFSDMEFGKSNNRVSGNYSIRYVNTDKNTEEKDLGITVR